MATTFKNLSQYVSFDLEGFLSGKELELTNIVPWIDFQSKEPLGIKAELTIIKDDTEYKPNAQGVITSNKYCKLDIKIKDELTLPIGSLVKVENVTKASVYGDFRNQLSVEAQRIVLVKKEGGK